MSEGFGLPTSVALGVGGIVGGGIYAAIGIVVAAAGVLTWLSYTIATAVVLCAAYAYTNINQITDSEGGSVSFIEELTGWSTGAAVVGWTLTVGYIGTMAMYSYAFGAFAEMMIGMSYLAGLPMRQLLSVGMVALFIGLNLLGAGSSTAVERYLVIVQAGIIAVFGVWALFFGFANRSLGLGLSEFGINAFVAASVSFVSFEGWQLQLYSQSEFENPKQTLKKGIYLSIAVASFIYVLVGFVITSLLPPATIGAQPEAALLFASLEIDQYLALAVGISALVATASAVNSTLFNSAIFADNLASRDILPEEMGSHGDRTVPIYAVLVIGFLTALFTSFGSLEAVVEFASLMYIVVFGAVCALAFLYREEADISAISPLVGVVGCVFFFFALLWFLYTRLYSVFVLVVAIAIVVFAVEALYFGRDSIRKGAQEIEEDI
ncbi:APC family permease [Halobacteriales archaeon QS_4_69_34]|nr:MAG: APC family permease [Halobacteriales archaeon QS_4_69_34]